MQRARPHGVPDRELQRMRTVARVLDHDLVDPLIGLVLPFVGDVLGALFGLYIVLLAARRHASPVVIVRMLLNLALDTFIGAIPILGDMFDFGFKANQRNVALLSERLESGGRATRLDWALVVAAGAGFLVFLGLVIWAAIALVRAIV